MSKGDIEDIRDKWSKQPEGKAWKNAFEAMAMQKAAKHFLKPYAAQKEGLAMAIATEDDKFDGELDVPDFIEAEKVETKPTKKDSKDLFE